MIKKVACFVKTLGRSWLEYINCCFYLKSYYNLVKTFGATMTSKLLLQFGWNHSLAQAPAMVDWKSDKEEKKRVGIKDCENESCYS